MIYVKPVDVETWGKCIELSNGKIKLLATIDFGPRIIRYGFVNEPNVFFEDTVRKAANQGKIYPVYGDEKWNLYGGHRLWTSPESIPRTYYPDNQSVEWETMERGVRLIAAEEKWNQLQKTMEIQMDRATGAIAIRHSITNKGPWLVEFAVWAVTAVRPGGCVVVPLPRGGTVNQTKIYEPDLFLSIWPHSRLNDPRVHWGEKFITVKQARWERPFKFGFNNAHGWAAYFNEGNVFVKSYTHNSKGTYPDGGVSCETYVCDRFAELETLGELEKVHPGETIHHLETWNLYRGVELPANLKEDELENLLRVYMK
ncbi:MAG: hypothetical protein K0R75_3770 [Paenibacillaceae bacterium]|nr:hypothetical protein [Paenibacillaceae bacterium]